MQVRKNRVGLWNNNKLSRIAEEPTESLRRIFDRQTQSSESTAAATVAFNDIESSMYKRRRMQMPLLPIIE